MALTRADETDLLTALHGGVHEQPRWRTFLERLRRRTRADCAMLIFGQGDAPMHRATQVHAGRDVRAEAERLEELARLDPIAYRRLRPERVYSRDDLLDPADPRSRRFRDDYLERIGVTHSRLMRVVEPGGSNAWAILLRDREPFGPADGALLAALAPHLALALRTFAALEQARVRAAISDDVLRRAGLDWTFVDARDADAGSDRNRVVVPPAASPSVAAALPGAVAVSRRARVFDDRHVALLARAFALTTSEARLALALAQGRSLADAAGHLRLTIATARNYSKRLYAKTGTSGQPRLVRLVLDSVALLG